MGKCSVKTSRWKMPANRLFSAVVIMLLAGTAAWAELQNVEIGGEMRMRYRLYRNTFNQGPALQVRVPAAFLPKRAIGPNGAVSLFKWDDNGPDWSFYETALQLNFRADFTEDVSAFVELYDFYPWGQDFRSNWITGQDNRVNARAGENVEIFQGYIDVENMYGTPLRLRIGRQALTLGKGWLVCEMLTPTQRLSFDGFRLTYDVPEWSVDAFAYKLTDRSPNEQDGDTDFYGVYATYKALEPVDISAYWYWLRDARSVNDTNFFWLAEWAENVVGVDDYDTTNLHTIGMRANGKYAGFDYDLELAYQFGDADVVGGGFVPNGLIYGDDSAEFDALAGEFTLGYTFADVAWAPRPFVQAVYFGGEDNRDISFFEWLNPFHRSEASVSFNRLFSDKNYMPVINDNGWMSNYYAIGAGVQVQPRENIRVNLQAMRAWAVEPFDSPWAVKIGKFRVPIAPMYPFLTQENSDDLGWELAAWVRYEYTKDLWFLLYYSRLFADDGLTDGAFSQFNGLWSTGGTDDSDADYLFLMAVLKF